MMYSDKPRPGLRRRLIPLIAALLLALLVLLGGRALYATVTRDLTAQAAATLRQTVLDTAIQCYAVEGNYPPDLQYLEDNYGLRVNHNNFIVTYEAVGSNLLPDVTVLEL